MKGWYGQSHRHYLAAKGIKTNYYGKKQNVLEFKSDLKRNKAKFGEVLLDVSSSRSSPTSSEFEKQLKMKVNEIQFKILSQIQDLYNEGKISKKDVKDLEYTVARYYDNKSLTNEAGNVLIKRRIDDALSRISRGDVETGNKMLREISGELKLTKISARYGMELELKELEKRRGESIVEAEKKKWCSYFHSKNSWI